MSSLLGEALGLVGSDEEKEGDGLEEVDEMGSEEEEKQLQNMMYNLMVRYAIY